MTLNEFNNLWIQQRKELLFQCCGCTKWAEQLALRSPYETIAGLKLLSDNLWKQCNEKDLLEAFSHHPKIGDLQSLEKKFASTKHLAESEQSAVNSADISVLEDLKILNETYYNKFGFIFIVCATGKSAVEMLELLKNRIVNNREEELLIAAAEQNKITHIRIEKLFT